MTAVPPSSSLSSPSPIRSVRCARSSRPSFDPSEPASESSSSSSSLGGSNSSKIARISSSVEKRRMPCARSANPGLRMNHCLSSSGLASFSCIVSASSYRSSMRSSSSSSANCTSIVHPFGIPVRKDDSMPRCCAFARYSVIVVWSWCFRISALR